MFKWWRKRKLQRLEQEVIYREFAHKTLHGSQTQQMLIDWLVADSDFEDYRAYCYRKGDFSEK
jgi:hypothetical protein